MEHTQQCLSDGRKAEAQREAYRKRWPLYCPYCGGWGGEWVRLEPQSGSEFDFEPCAQCAGSGLCPRCKLDTGEAIFEEAGGEECPACGFLPGQSMGLPEAPPCECWVEGPEDDFPPY